MVDNWQKIEKRISERTGLKSQEEINAYAYFCEHSDFRDGIIMYRDVEHEFYEELWRKSSKPMQELENAYHDSVGNHENTGDEENRLRSPLSRRAQQIFAEYYHKFISLRLISPPESHLENRYDSSQYPKLTGYNYFNDPEFYRAEGNGRELIL